MRKRNPDEQAYRAWQADRSDQRAAYNYLQSLRRAGNVPTIEDVIEIENSLQNHESFLSVFYEYSFYDNFIYDDEEWVRLVAHYSGRLMKPQAAMLLAMMGINAFIDSREVYSTMLENQLIGGIFNDLHQLFGDPRPPANRYEMPGGFTERMNYEELRYGIIQDQDYSERIFIPLAIHDSDSRDFFQREQSCIFLSRNFFRVPFLMKYILDIMDSERNPTLLNIISIVFMSNFDFNGKYFDLDMVIPHISSSRIREILDESDRGGYGDDWEHVHFNIMIHMIRLLGKAGALSERALPHLRDLISSGPVTMDVRDEALFAIRAIEKDIKDNS